MTTGYTAPVHDGVATFESFIWHCASSGYHDSHITLGEAEERSAQEYVEQERAELRRLMNFTASGWQAEQSADREKCLAFKKTMVEEHAVVRARYLDMLRQVQAWKPPSKEHEDLKTCCRWVGYCCGACDSTELYVGPICDDCWGSLPHRVHLAADRYQRKCSKEIQSHEARRSSEGRIPQHRP